MKNLRVSFSQVDTKSMISGHITLGNSVAIDPGNSMILASTEKFMADMALEE